jgi:hypothetical protein
MKIASYDEWFDIACKVRDTPYIQCKRDTREYYKSDLGSAVCWIQINQKTGIAYVGGLASDPIFGNGHGRELLSSILKKHKRVQLDCIGKKLRRYYESFGFKVLWKAKCKVAGLTNKKYYLMEYKNE